jgi:hypothetical protein
MTASETRGRPEAVAVSVTDDSLVVDLVDGRTVSVPLGWYPRLAHGRLRNARTFASSVEEKAFTGRGSTRTSALTTYWPVALRVSRSSRYSGGFATGNVSASAPFLKGKATVAFG